MSRASAAGDGIRLATWQLLGPALAWLLLLIVIPHVDMLTVALRERVSYGEYRFSLRHFAEFFTEPLYWRTFMRTAVMSILATLLTLVIAFPVAWYIAKMLRGRVRSLLFMACLVPFWVSELVRTYGWMILLRESGVVSLPAVGGARGRAGGDALQRIPGTVGPWNGTRWSTSCPWKDCGCSTYYPRMSRRRIVRVVSDLRAAGHPAGLVAAVLNQSKLRARAEAKFGPFAASMTFTEAGLEQATRLSVAARHAGRFQRAGLHWIADLGCGVGADALAIAALELEVTAVERDEVTAAIAAYNLAPWSNARVEHADAESFDLAGIDGVYLDPARRDGVKRLKNPADWSPSLDFAYGLAQRLPVGVKLGPGIDRDLIPNDAEAQWVSVDHDVVEVGLWFGTLARQNVRRAALVIGQHGAAELTAESDSEDVPVGGLGQFLYEPDGAVIRARLIGDLGRRISGRMLDRTIAYLTTDEPAETPFALGFRIVADFALDQRSLKRELASRGIGTVEIKKRGVDTDPAAFRTALSPKGENSATLFLTRVGGKRRALLAERL